MYKITAFIAIFVFLFIVNSQAATVWEADFESPTYDSSIPWAENGTYNAQDNWFQYNINKGDWEIVTSGGPGVLSGVNMGKKTATSSTTYLTREFTAQTAGFTVEFAVAAGNDVGSGASNTIWVGDYSVDMWCGAGVRFTNDGNGLIINYRDLDIWYQLDMDPNTSGFQYASADTWYKFKLYIWPAHERWDLYVYDSNDNLITTALHLEPNKPLIVGNSYDSISFQYSGTDTSATFYYDEISITDSAPAIPESYNASSMYWDADDATQALQYAINSKSPTVVVPDMATPWKINTTIRLASNQELELASGVILEAKEGTFLEGIPLLKARDRSNVTISGYSATLRMQKDDYMNDPAYTALGSCESRHGISIYGCNGVTIEGLTIEDTGGDGVYIKGGSYLDYSNNIVIRDVICDNNYRQGISVISACNMLIEDCILKNTSGTGPSAGVDLEPNNPTDRLSNFIMQNCDIENNSGPGITVYLRLLAGSENDISILFQNCKIVNNSDPVDTERFNSGISIGTLMDNGPDGLIEFKNCTVDGSVAPGIYIRDKCSQGAALKFTDCSIKNTAKGFSGTVDYTTVPISIALNRPDLDNNLSDLGKVEFSGCKVEDYKDRPYLLVSSTDSSYDVRNLQGDINVYNPYGVWAEYSNINNVYDVDLQTVGLSDSYAGFEETRYSIGDLMGQQDWSGYQNSNCSREVVSSGTDNISAPQGNQMLKFSSCTTASSIYKSFAGQGNPVTTPFTLSYCFTWDGSQTGSDGNLWATLTANRDLYIWAGAGIYLKRESGVVYLAYRDGDTAINLDLDPAVSGTQGVVSGEWYRLVYNIRPSANNWDLYVYDIDGTLLASQINIGIRNGGNINYSYNSWETWGYDNDSGSLYLDDICLQLDQTYRNHAEEPSYQLGNLFDGDLKNWFGWQKYDTDLMSRQIVDGSSEPVAPYQGDNCIKLGSVTETSSVYQYFAPFDKPVVTPFTNSYCIAWDGSQAGSDGYLWAFWTTNRDLYWWAGAGIYLQRENGVVYLAYRDGATTIKLDLDSATGGVQGITTCEWYRLVYCVRPAADTWDFYVYDASGNLLASQTNIGIRNGSTINYSYNSWETWGYDNTAGTLYIDYYNSLNN